MKTSKTIQKNQHKDATTSDGGKQQEIAYILVNVRRPQDGKDPTENWYAGEMKAE
jgi:hypothetical protein